ncbi:hypothetical protein MCAV_06770 [[Mycoplasma] cavipharyngis]|uniref:hypothetical protein n=1 Tax=[Mycoplasma] cavipharyngis TaxID=92757 RepID=UPI003703860F
MDIIGINWNKFDLNQFDENSKLEIVENKKLKNHELCIVDDIISTFKKYDYWELGLDLRCEKNWNLVLLKIFEKLYDEFHKPNQSFNILYLANSFFWIMRNYFWIKKSKWF